MPASARVIRRAIMFVGAAARPGFGLVCGASLLLARRRHGFAVD
jgi:hypothetical protein